MISTTTAPPAARPPATARLRPADLARLASVGLAARKLRAALSALGIAIGVASIVAVLGLSASSSAGLLAEISRLGTNLLAVTNGQNLLGQTAELPTQAPAMIGRLPGVTAVQDTGSVTANVYRSPYIPAIQTNALSVQAASLGLLPDLATSIARGRLPQRRHRPGARRRPRRHRRPVPGHRPGLSRDEDLARWPVVLRSGHPQLGRPGPGH